GGSASSQGTAIARSPYIARPALDRMPGGRHIVASPRVGGVGGMGRGRMAMNRRFLTVALILSAAPFVTGCASPYKPAQGAGIGGAIVAGTGAAIGSATGNAGKGALIGGLIGAVTGGAIGNEKDMQEKREAEARVINAEERAAAASTQLGIADVIQMAKEGPSDQVIINQMRTTGSPHQLSPEDVRLLRSH